MRSQPLSFTIPGRSAAGVLPQTNAQTQTRLLSRVVGFGGRSNVIAVGRVSSDFPPRFFVFGAASLGGGYTTNQRLLLTLQTVHARGQAEETAACGFAARVAAIPEVIAVTRGAHSGKHSINTFVSDDGDKIRERVFAAELAILEEYPDAAVEFHLRQVPGVPTEIAITDLPGNPLFFRNVALSF
jgi:hypothetical protein